MFTHPRLCSGLAVAALILIAAQTSRAFEFSVPLSSPKLTRLSANIPVAGADGDANVALEGSSGNIDASIQVDPRGKISGTGRFTSGYGNEPAQDGKITGKVSPSSLAVKFKAGKQSLSFRGQLDGASFVGVLKVKSPPAKESLESFRIPVGNDLSLPMRDDDGGGSEEEHTIAVCPLENPQILNLYGEMSITRVIKSSGKISYRAYAFINTGDRYLVNYDGVKIDPQLGFPPAQTGTWITMPINLYDTVHPGQLSKFGAMTVDTTIVGGGTASGNFTVRALDGSVAYVGTWRLRDGYWPQ